MKTVLIIILWLGFDAVAVRSSRMQLRTEVRIRDGKDPIGGKPQVFAS
jgi:hypothetical protein